MTFAREKMVVRTLNLATSAADEAASEEEETSEEEEISEVEGTSETEVAGEVAGVVMTMTVAATEVEEDTAIAAKRGDSQATMITKTSTMPTRTLLPIFAMLEVPTREEKMETTNMERSVAITAKIETMTTTEELNRALAMTTVISPEVVTAEEEPIVDSQPSEPVCCKS